MSVLFTWERSATRPRIRPYLTPAFPTRNPPSGESRGGCNLNEPYSHVPSPLEKMNTAFIEALVVTRACQGYTATSCTPHLPIYRSPFTYHKTRRRHAQKFFKQTRFMQTLPKKAQPVVPPPLIARNEYLKMLDYYRDPAPFPSFEDYPQPLISAFSQSVAQISHVVDQKATALIPKPAEGATEIAVEGLLSKLDREGCPHDTILEAYSALPYPGVAHLSPVTLRRLLRRLSTVENKNLAGLLRYLSIVNDMKAADLPMIGPEWCSVLALTGGCITPVRAADLESALKTWNEMEQNRDAQGGKVAYNILFDLAAKAGQYVLAEMILKEMQARNIPLDRFTRTSIIYYHGLQGDGDAVRDAYRAFVDAGEIVDTVVMNCVIASLIHAGEPQAAELVYERMKRNYSVATDGSPASPWSWKRSRALGRYLQGAVKNVQVGSEEHQSLQNQQLLCPDQRTYILLIDYYASQTGELRRIITLLKEMQALQVPMHGRIYVKVLKGFAKHGGLPYTLWTGARLERVLISLLEMLDRQGDDGEAAGEAADDVRLGKWMVVWAVRAFHRCCGQARAMDIWTELRSRWKPSHVEEKAVLIHLENTLGEHLDEREGSSPVTMVSLGQ